MDAQAWRIRELVNEACGLVVLLERAGAEPRLVAELEHVRGQLCALACETPDGEAADAAKGVADDIDAALAGARAAAPQRLAG